MSLVGQLFKAELVKIRSTRTALGLTLGMVAWLLLLVILVTANAKIAKLTGPDGTRTVLADTSFGSVFALCLGIIAMAGEYRHGTIGHALVAAPRRWPVVAGKLLGGFVAGAVLGILAVIVVYGAGAATVAARGESLSFAGSLPLRIAIGTVLGYGLFTALGVGLGALVKDQVLALGIGIGWTQLVELFVSNALGDAGRYFPGAALDALIRRSTDHPLPQGAAGLVLLGYTALIAGAGVYFVRRRDLT